jgi:thymidylate synthase
MTSRRKTEPHQIGSKQVVVDGVQHEVRVFATKETPNNATIRTKGKYGWDKWSFHDGKRTVKSGLLTSR